MGSTGETANPPSRPQTESGKFRQVDTQTRAIDAGGGSRTRSALQDTEGRGKGETRSVIEACNAELADGPPPMRRARLHYSIARELEASVGRLDQALEHYYKALEANPEHFPSIRGARRSCVAAGRYRDALPLFDAELKHTGDPRAKSMLHYAKGRLLEDSLGDFDRARSAYQRARELDATNSAALKALERIESGQQQWAAVAEVLREQANALPDDGRYRAAVMVERARILERQGQTAQAVDLYSSALRLDPDHPGPSQALERLHHDSRSWRLVSELFEREAERTNDKELAALLLRRSARLRAEHQDGGADAMSALAAAMALQPQEPLVLDELAPLYQHGERVVSLAEVLRQQILIASDPGERAALLYSLGHIYELLAHDQEATVCYENALELDPIHQASIMALDRLYVRYENWQGLIRIYVTEAGYTEDAARGAAGHVRAAEIYEERLGNQQAAMDHFSRALARVPLHPTAFKALVRLYRHNRHWRELVELYDRAAQMETEHNQVVALLFQTAQVWEDALGDPDRSASAYQRILELEPANLAAIQGLQRVTERAGRHRELVSALELELTLASSDERRLALHHRIGTILADHLEDPDAAIQHFGKMLEIDPTHPPALSGLGRLFRASGRWEELLDIYQRELIREGDGRRSAVLLHRMGELCERCLGDDERAIESYRRALDHDASYRPALRALARQLRARKDWPALVESLKLEAEDAADNHLRAIGWYRVGEVYEYHLGDSDKAARAYEIAVASAPGHRPSLAALARLRQDRGDWHTLLDELATEISLTSDDNRKVALSILRGAVYRDELDDVTSASACYESVLTDEVGRLPALLALEKLYAASGDYDNLAATYQAIADVTRDRNGQIAALREMVRVMESRGVGTHDQLLGVYHRILELCPGDLHTLERLEDLAAGAGDHALAEKVYRQLVDNSKTDELRAHYLTQLAAAMEAQKNYRALEVYRQAIAENREQRAAIRGLARLAEAVGDPIGLADASRIEAEQTSDASVAAALYARSAVLRLGPDPAGGIADLRKALELAPEFREAARSLTAALTAADRIDELTDDLSAAARASRDPERAAELWLQVAGLQADDLGRYGAAIGALQRGLEARDDHVPSLLKLAELHRHEKQWREAVSALERVLGASRERDLFCSTQLALARLWDQHLDEFDKAKACVRAVLERHELNAEALSLQADYLVRDGEHEKAAELIRKLAAESDDDKSRANALVRLAEIEQARQDDRAAEEALKQALSMDGPGGRAAGAYRKFAETHGSWVGYAAGLSSYLTSVKAGELSRPEPSVLIAGYQELARTYDTGMNLPKKSIEALQDALAETDGSPAIYLELAERLRRAGRIGEAVGRCLELLAVDATQAEAWSLMATLFEDQGRRHEARYVRQPLSVLEVKGMDLPRTRAKTLSNPVSLGVVHALSPDGATRTPAAALLASAADAAGKLFPPALDRYGLSRRDRITSRSAHPLRDAAERIAEIFTVEEFDFYVHEQPGPLLSLELTEPAAIVVSSAAARLSGSQQAFLLAYAMAALAARFHPALRLSARELELFLAASARAVSETASSPLAGPARLSEHAQTVKKAIPRRWRRAFEVAGGEYARARINVAHWQQSLLHTAIRSALIVCDDLRSGIKVLRRMHSMPDLRGHELVASSRTVSDLMRFWISDDAFVARRATGLIPTPMPPRSGPGGTTPPPTPI